MTKSQIEACQKRNEQMKQDIVEGKVTIANVTKTCADIDSLLVDLQLSTEQVRLERLEQQELRNRIGRESTQKADCMRSAAVLRDKLKWARTFLETFDQTTFTPQEKKELKDMLTDA